MIYSADSDGILIENLEKSVHKMRTRNKIKASPGLSMKSPLQILHIKTLKERVDFLRQDYGIDSN